MSGPATEDKQDAQKHLSNRGTALRVSPRRQSILAFSITFILSLVIWLLLSGKFDLFHISLGIISCIIVSASCGSLLFPAGVSKNLAGLCFRFTCYIPWLLYEILKANIHVMYLAFHPRMRDLINPKLIRFKTRIKDEMGLFIFANSITLTPGTITVYVSIYGTYTVHCIDDHSGESLPGEMEERVARIFGE